MSMQAGLKKANIPTRVVVFSSFLTKVSSNLHILDSLIFCEECPELDSKFSKGMALSRPAGKQAWIRLVGFCTVWTPKAHF